LQNLRGVQDPRLLQLLFLSDADKPCWLIPQLGGDKQNKVIICVFVENHGNPILLSLQIMAMLTRKVMLCVENLQIAYCVYRRNTNIPGYCCQRSGFCDCYHNMGHFLCSVERIKRLVNVHLHCIVSNVPSKGRKYSGSPELLRSEISFSRTCNIPKQWKSTQTRSYLNEMLFCSYFDKIVYLLYNSQSV